MYSILFQNNDFLVINKAAGIGFHDEDGVDGICSIVRKDIGRLVFPVHRLDKVTSGLLLLAKSSEAAAKLAKLFELHEIQKYYLGVIDSKPKKKQGLVKGDMERSRRSMWRLTKTLTNPAVTQFFTQSIGDGKRLVVLKPHTGKTHQLRVALNSLGSPICGDPLYQSADAWKYDRAYLHAYCLQFTLDGEDFSFVADELSGKEFETAACKEALVAYAQPETLAWPKV
ncbi:MULTISPECIES: TIGR01621 family pseudouridine synthase [unclassified Moritella]|uniref:TIGR01621 family pseudouridine synthase n=1 Tax=Moritella TaxID=58050 RepID=UPI0018E1344C|nr:MULTISPECIES: TIGR01621 family pseudouridine synthase [unclassified Moritella]MDX2321262.1 TIGR01621 family pseudouridine synthase [Moritella sp.]GIC76012.1 RNA pseudouridine synthase [Moritella sp. F1]GIC81551.1 RNA pseudouridine synthase [Moritella sp. F3]